MLKQIREGMNKTRENLSDFFMGSFMQKVWKVFDLFYAVSKVPTLFITDLMDYLYNKALHYFKGKEKSIVSKILIDMPFVVYWVISGMRAMLAGIAMIATSPIWLGIHAISSIVKSYKSKDKDILNLPVIEIEKTSTDIIYKKSTLKEFLTRHHTSLGRLYHASSSAEVLPKENEIAPRKKELTLEYYGNDHALFKAYVLVGNENKKGLHKYANINLNVKRALLRKEDEIKQQDEYDMWVANSNKNNTL